MIPTNFGRDIDFEFVLYGNFGGPEDVSRTTMGETDLVYSRPMMSLELYLWQTEIEYLDKTEDFDMRYCGQILLAKDRFLGP